MTLPLEDPSPPFGESSNGEARPSKQAGDLHKTITMAQIARAAGVSQGAISSLLNDRDYGIRVSDKTRERVFKVCRDMGYVPNDLRAVVRMYPDRGEFCLLISRDFADGLLDPFVARIAKAAMQAIGGTSHSITLAFYERNADYLADPDALPQPARSGIASKFLLCGEVNASLLQHILRRGLPAISLGWDANVPGAISLTPDFACASRLAIEHLFNLGHRRIAILSGPFGSNDPRIIELHSGVKQAYDHCGMTIEAQNIVYGRLNYQAGVEAAAGFLSRSAPPTAAFCLSDAAAGGVIAGANARGLRVPLDFSVIGCADDDCAQMLQPPLTTIHLPIEELAATGVQELDRLTKSGARLETQKRVLPVRLLERGSTGPAPGSAA